MGRGSISSRDYVKWVQRSLNRLLSISLRINGNDKGTSYREAVKYFNKAYLNRNFSDVDKKTQNALIKANEKDPRYVVWLHSALISALNKNKNRSRNMDSVVEPIFSMNSTMRQMVRSFQRNNRSELKIDGFIGAKTELTIILATFMAPPGSRGSTATAFIDTSGHPTAADFYVNFSREPILPTGEIRVSSIKKIPDMTLDSLLQELVKSTAKNILICCHGTPKGLSIDLFKHADAKLGGFAAELLAQWADGDHSDDFVDGFLKWTRLSEQDLRKYQKNIKSMRSKKLNRVELRSCNTGVKTEILEQLRKFFNCRSLTAPVILDGYAPITPSDPLPFTPAFNKFLKRKSIVREGTKPNRFAIAKKIGKGNKLLMPSIMESTKAFHNFINNHFIVTGGTKFGKGIPGHALIPSGKPIFPKDSAYRTKLKMVT